MKLYNNIREMINKNFKLIFLLIVIIALSIRLWIFYANPPSKYGRVGVTVSHIDLALGIMNGEEFSFNVERHVWIEKNINLLLDNPIEKTPDFSNSERAPITYMDPGYGMLIGYFFKVLNVPLNMRSVQFVQIILDVLLLFILYSLSRGLGLSPIISLIPVAVHGFNLAILRIVFQLVQDHLILILITSSVWLLVIKPKNSYQKLFQYAGIFILGGLIPWVRSIFVLYALFVFTVSLILYKLARLNKRYVLLTGLFTLGFLLLYQVPRNVQFSRENLSFSFGRPGCFWYPFYMGLHQYDDGPTGDELARPKVYSIDSELQNVPIVTTWTKMDSILKPVVIEEIQAAPMKYIFTSCRRLFESFFPSFYGNFDNKLNIPVVFIYFAKLMMLMISGIILIYAIILFLKKLNNKLLFLLLPWIYVAFVSAPFFLQGRSLISTLDLLVVFFIISLYEIKTNYSSIFTQFLYYFRMTELSNNLSSKIKGISQ